MSLDKPTAGDDGVTANDNVESDRNAEINRSENPLRLTPIP